MRTDLPQDQRNRIRAEEIFREELRRELEQQRPPKSLGSQIWTAANSSFGIWLLSTVVLGLGVWSWTLIQEHRAAQKAAAEKLVKVNFEIYRDFWEFFGDAQKSWNHDQYKRAHKTNLQRPEYKLSDFKDKTMTELLWILGEVPPSSNHAHSQEISSIIESFWNDLITPLYNVGTLDEKKKREIDQRIIDTMYNRVFPILYPKQYPTLLPSSVTLLHDITTTSSDGQAISVSKGASFEVASIRDGKATLCKDGNTFAIPLEATNGVDLIFANMDKKRAQKTHFKLAHSEEALREQQTPTEQGFEMSGAFGLVAHSPDDPAEKLKKLDANQGKEYGRLYAHVFIHDLERNFDSPTALDMLQNGRSRIATEADKIGVPVEIRNAFVDGYSLGINEIAHR